MSGLTSEEADKIESEIGPQVSMLSSRIKNGTPLSSGAGKCWSCESAWIIQIARKNETIIRCSTYGNDMIVPHDIIRCNRYRASGELGIWDLIKMHNPVDLSKPDKVMGFKEPEKKEEGL